FAPEAAVLLNLTEDHLDRHATVEDYRRAKLRAFVNQRPEDLAVAPRELVEAGDLPGRARRVSFGPCGSEMEDRDGVLWWRGEQLIDASEIYLRGDHNRENAMAAAAVTLARGADPEAVRAALRAFVGVPHRLEEITEHDGVVYVNDSKATNVESAAAGIRAFD